MSVYHIPEAKRSITPERCTINKMLVENEHLIETITSYQKTGRIDEATQYQLLLHRNLKLLAQLTNKKKNILQENE